MVNFEDCKEHLPLVTDIARARSILLSTNWSFRSRFYQQTGAMPLFDCRKHHWFPATFIPEIPFTLIEVLTKPGALVYDPFAGIGTTFFQALLSGRRPLATEVNRIAVLVMKGLLILFDPKLDSNMVLEQSERLLEKYDSSRDYVGQMVEENPLFERMKPWYHPQTLQEIAFLATLERQCDVSPIKAAIGVCLSAILKGVSSQERGWGCIADNVTPKGSQLRVKEVFGRFRSHLRKLLEDIGYKVKQAPPTYQEVYDDARKRECIVYADVRFDEKVPGESVDLLVTSPPYPNMTDYVTSQRLSYYWQGFDPSDDLRQEIGARRKRFSPDSLTHYRKDMRKAAQSVSNTLKDGAYACFVMPVFRDAPQNDTARRHVVDGFLSDLRSYGLFEEGTFDRQLPHRRREHNEKWVTLKEERIYLFRMDKGQCTKES